MAEPLTAGSVTASALTGWGLLTSAFIGFITSVDYAVVFGAFAGSICFVVTAQNLTRWQALGYFIFGYAAGIFGAGFIADWIENKFDYRDKPLDSLAAVVISAAAVHGYFWLKNGGLLRLPFIKKHIGGDHAK